MAPLNNLCVMMIFVLSAALMGNIGVSQADELPDSPEVEPASAEVPEAKYLHYLIECVDNLSSKCRDQIFFGTFYGNATVDRDCCHKLVNDMGKRCHDDLINFILKSPRYNQNDTEIALNSGQIWENCVSSVPAAPQPAQVRHSLFRE